MNTDTNFLFVKYVPKCSWADLMAALLGTLQSAASVWGQACSPSVCAVPKLCQVELQFRWHCGCNSINRNAVQINFNFELNIMWRALKKYSVFVILIVAEESGWDVTKTCWFLTSVTQGTVFTSLAALQWHSWHPFLNNEKSIYLFQNWKQSGQTFWEEVVYLKRCCPHVSWLVFLLEGSQIIARFPVL